MPVYRYESRRDGVGSLSLPVCPECEHGDYQYVYRNYANAEKRELVAFRCAACKCDLELDFPIRDMWIVGLWNVADPDFAARYIGPLADWEPSKDNPGTKARAEKSPYIVRE